MKPWKKTLLIGIIIAVTSQLYWNLFTEGFRISSSVILLPVLLMTIGKDEDSLKTGVVTGCIIFIFRLILSCGRGIPLETGVMQVLPNALFYICYGFLFAALVRNKHTATMDRLIVTIFICDFISNLFEVSLQIHLKFDGAARNFSEYLFLIALLRTAVAGVILVGEKQYRVLLTRAEHETRYQRLFLMTTGLKNEIYFMKKNSEEIESVMSNAYRLYEKLSDMGVSEETKKMSLAIARDVHEIKKDYIRIIQGIEEAIDEEYDEEKMSLQDVLHILKDTTYQMLEAKKLDIHLEFRYKDNFMTRGHYGLMAILKNLVNNAIEAIESADKRGCIRIFEEKQDDKYIFRVIDDGPGIPDKHLPNIFQMGYSTKFDYKTGNIYRGVGLCGVKMAVEEQFQGTIEVDSKVGKGTEFKVEIPSKILEEI